jgi:hypothetical protein
MIYNRNKNKNTGSIICINLFANKIIFNKGFEIKDNELFELNQYKIVLDKARMYVSEPTIKLIEEYFEVNSEEINKLMKINSGNGQLSMF